MVMLCNAFGIKPIDGTALSQFADYDQINTWARPYVAAMVKAGYISGVGENKLAPTGQMTRGALMVVLNRAIVQYISKPGTYTLSDGDGLNLVSAGNDVQHYYFQWQGLRNSLCLSRRSCKM